MKPGLRADQAVVARVVAVVSEVTGIPVEQICLGAEAEEVGRRGDAWASTARMIVAWHLATIRGYSKTSIGRALGVNPSTVSHYVREMPRRRNWNVELDHEVRDVISQLEPLTAAHPEV